MLSSKLLKFSNLSSVRKMSNNITYRKEKDTFGFIDVPAHRYWGAQTQRSLQNFKIGGQRERMPEQLIQAFGYLKKSAALVNVNFGLDPNVSKLVAQACDEIIQGKLHDEFPLGICIYMFISNFSYLANWIWYAN